MSSASSNPAPRPRRPAHPRGRSGPNGRSPRAGRAFLLDLDPKLAAGLSERQREAARRELIVQTIRVEPGGQVDPAPLEAAFAVLVVEGVLGLHTAAGHGRTLEILTRGSICRPAEESPASFVDSSMRALARTRLALLDERLCRWPPLTSEIVSRLCQRIRSAHAQKAMDSQPGLERRVLFCLWRLAESCGRRRPDGVEVPVPLTHELLAEVMGAARPSVTTALRRLASAGVVTRTHARGWLLRSDSVDRLFTEQAAAPF